MTSAETAQMLADQRRKVGGMDGLPINALHVLTAAVPRPITLTLPYPPPLNNLYATIGRRRVLSQRGKAFKQAALVLAIRAAPKIYDCPVAVTLNVYRPRRRGDLDGAFKVVLDSLTGMVWHDDEQVVEIHAWRHEDKVNPRVEVTIEPRASGKGEK